MMSFLEATVIGREPRLLEFVLDQRKTTELCEKALEGNLYTVKFVLD